MRVSKPDSTCLPNPASRTMAISKMTCTIFWLLQGSRSIGRHGIGHFIDELQYVRENELEALITALHRTSQRRLPVILKGVEP
jgi:hypothetical protein